MGTDGTANFIYEFLNWYYGKMLKQKGKLISLILQGVFNKEADASVHLMYN
jgi:hypothetical protein